MGICSTTYGDLVCRGCKRFAHEIVQWNSYDIEQQERVWQRLLELREAVVEHHLAIVDADLFAASCARSGIDPVPPAPAIYRLLGVLVKCQAPLSSVGLQASLAGDTADDVALRVLQAVDAEIYKRSLAHYERNFKIPL